MPLMYSFVEFLIAIAAIVTRIDKDAELHPNAELQYEAERIGKLLARAAADLYLPGYAITYTRVWDWVANEEFDGEKEWADQDPHLYRVLGHMFVRPAPLLEE